MKKRNLDTRILNGMSLASISLMILEGKSLFDNYRSSSDMFENSLQITSSSFYGRPYEVKEEPISKYLKNYFNWMARNNYQRNCPGIKSFII